jgi:putative endonuclease
MKNYFVYIVICSDDSYYTGVTNDLERRIAEHNFGNDEKSYTYSRKPVKLVYSELFNDIKDAIKAEKQIKGWTRKKKEALISNDVNKLKELAKCKNNTSSEKYKQQS